MAPQVEASGTTLSVSVSPELAEAIGIEPRVYTTELPYGTTSHLRMLTTTIEAVSGQDAIAALDTVVKRAYDAANAPGASSNQDLQNAYAALATRRYELKIKPDDIALRLQVTFADPHLDWHGIEVGSLASAGSIYLAFSPLLDNDPVKRATPLVLLGAKAAFLGDVDTKIEDHLLQITQQIASYLRLILARAAGENTVATSAAFVGGNWQIRHFTDLPRPVRGAVVPGLPGPRSPGDDSPASPVGGGASRATAGEGAEIPPPAEPLGEWPPEFQVVDDGAIARLDRIHTLIVVMMENRSFDHLLGRLQEARPGRGYDGMPADSSNPPSGGFVERVPAVPIESLFPTYDFDVVTRIPVGPHHAHGPVMFQIGGGEPETAGTGEMQGFTRDLVDRTDASQFAMSYYSLPHLPTYTRFIDEFKVCDRWFAALPGPTYPNRWITLCGVTPELENIENNDPRLGYLKQPTIFDALTRHGIEWRYYESDLSILRMFDRYRIDDERVLGLHDATVGLEALLAGPAPLPRVIFVEPNFVDIPPIKTANDDHPPADLAHGQAFLAEICNLVWRSGRWAECTLLVTYDEHGGFYDHVAPPGTEHGAPEWRGKIPPVHPDGPPHLGVRVPAFVVSPYVNAGTPTHQMFDHTSIIKSILVHNRRSLPRSVFTQFGARVNMIAHLGEALDDVGPRATPPLFTAQTRSIPPAPPIAPTSPAHGPIAPPKPLKPPVGLATPGHAAPPPAAGPASPPPAVAARPPTAPVSAAAPVVPRPRAAAAPRDFHESLRGLFLPRRPRP